MLANALFSAVLSVAAPGNPVTVQSCNLGEIYQAPDVQCKLTFANESAHAVILTAPPLQQGNMTGPVTVPAHGLASVNLTFDFLSDAGSAARFLTFNFQNKAQMHVGTAANAFVLSVLDEPRPKIEFGAVDLSKPMPMRKVQLTSRDVANFKIERIVSAPAYLDASIAADGTTISATIKPTATWGVHKDRMLVALNTPQQKYASIEVDADVHGAVVPDSNPFALGLLRKGNANSALIRLTQRDGKAFRIGNLALEGVVGKVSSEPCVPEKAGCKLIKVSIADSQPTGLIKGRVLVSLPESHQTLPVTLWGLFVDKDTEVRDLNKEMAAGKSRVKPTVSLADAIQSATHKDAKTAAAAGTTMASAAPEIPPGDGPLLKWQTSNEARVYGYLIYRADSDKGPFVRVNKQIVHVPDGLAPDAVSSYVWRDNSAEAGKTYWYYIGLLNRDGSKQQLSGPQKVIAK